MTDLIDRQAAIDEMARWSGYIDNDMILRLQIGLEKLPPAQPERWIPCSERLPDSDEDVLCDDDGRVTIGYCIDEEIGWHDMHSYRIYPNAWMPLPEPYKGEQT